MSYRFQRPLSELLASMTTEDLMLYVAEEGIEPRGESRADLRSGIVAAACANPWRGKDRQPFKPVDFMPQFGKPKRQKSAATLKMELRAYTLAVGGTVKEGAANG